MNRFVAYLGVLVGKKKMNIINHDEIVVFAKVTETRSPFVFVVWSSGKLELSPTQANSRALSLIRAATIAESEAKLLKKMGRSLLQDSSGRTSAGYSQQEAIKNLLPAFYSTRPKFPYYVSPFVHLGEYTPLLEYQVASQRKKIRIDTALTHAQDLIIAAENSNTNAFLVDFARNNDLDSWQEQELIRSNFRFRQQKQLERML